MHNPLTTICSRAWTDLNIDFYVNRWRYCCKSVWAPLPDKYEYSFFTDNPQIKKTRNDLLNGIETDSCKWCWKDYKETGTAWRDIVNLWDNTDNASNPKHNLPDQIVITFDNTCDQSCLYCGPDESSKWASELNVKLKSTDIKNKIDSLIEWIVQTYDNSVSSYLGIQIMGGEPTYSNNFYYFLEKFINIQFPKNLNIVISLTTNGNTNKRRMFKLLDYIDKLPFEWHIGLSNESSGNIAENIRYGLNINNFGENLKTYLNTEKISRVIFSPTMNVFNVKNFHNYIKWVHSIVSCTNAHKEVTWVGNWVNDAPMQFDCKHLPKSFSKYIELAIDTMKETSKNINLVDEKDIYVFLNKISDRIKSNEENSLTINQYLDHLGNIKKTLDKQLLLEQIHE